MEDADLLIIDALRPPGSSGDGIVGLGANLTSVPLPGPPMAPFYGLPPGTDIRGLGLETFVGRGAVRNSTGATRPPTIPPELWQLKSPELKAEAVDACLAQLAADAAAFAGVAAPGVTAELSASTKATVGSSALAEPTEESVVSSALADLTDWQSKLIHDDDLPRLPREFETLRKPHRERNGTCHPPGCIARKLPEREMDACPKARKALGAEWEKLRTLKRPHPVRGEGAWDEGNVKEALSSFATRKAAISPSTIQRGR